MNRKSACLVGAAAGAFGFGGTATAADTTTYTYDALGRLVAVATSTGPNNGLNVGMCYDPAGNRSTYTVASGGSAACSSPPPPPSPLSPPPPASNQPPVTAPDSLSVEQCGDGTRDVLVNDSDPEGNYPLVLVSVSTTGLGAASIISSNTIEFTAGSSIGSSTLTYTVEDSLGAASTGTLNITVTSGTCN